MTLFDFLILFFWHMFLLVRVIAIHNAIATANPICIKLIAIRALDVPIRDYSGSQVV